MYGVCKDKIEVIVRQKTYWYVSLGLTLLANTSDNLFNYFI